MIWKGASDKRRYPSAHRVADKLEAFPAKLVCSRNHLWRPVDEMMDDARVRPYQEPFRSRDARRALADTAKGLGPRGFETIEAGLRNLEIPMRIIYGTEDRILPDVGETMERVQRDVADCELTALEGVGHFLQEERGREIGDLLAPFYAS